MGLLSFVKSAGKMLGIGKDAPPSAEDLKREVAGHGLAAEGLDVAIEGDTVKVSGTAPNQEMKEKILLALGNISGVAKVAEEIGTPSAEPEAAFHTVTKGETLSAIAKRYYGNANAYMAIFEANKPMLDHPDKIYPGQVLRIPPKS